MASGTPQTPCPNCGHSDYASPFEEFGDNWSGAITSVFSPPSAQRKYNPTRGHPVEVFVCKNCGEVRLFAIQ